MTSALIIFPHQLFADHPGLALQPDLVVLFEDPLFFGDPVYPANFHKQKLWLHRSSMANYKLRLEDAGHRVRLVRYRRDAGLLCQVVAQLGTEGFVVILASNPVDDIAGRRLASAAQAAGLRLKLLPTPGFINSAADNQSWSDSRSRWFMAEFYKHQRRRLGVMMEGDQPMGGQWSFDEDNRKKVPKTLLSEIPPLPRLEPSPIDLEARASVLAEFPKAPGKLDRLYLPTTHEAAERCRNVVCPVIQRYC